MTEQPISCLRCNTMMEYHGDEKLQLGETGFFTGHLSNLFAGAIEVSIYYCPKCGKLEFFLLDE